MSSKCKAKMLMNKRKAGSWDVFLKIERLLTWHYILKMGCSHARCLKSSETLRSLADDYMEKQKAAQWNTKTHSVWSKQQLENRMTDIKLENARQDKTWTNQTRNDYTGPAQARLDQNMVNYYSVLWVCVSVLPSKVMSTETAGPNKEQNRRVKIIISNRNGVVLLC